MGKYEVDRVHNSKDGEIYQIAQSVEQKVRTGMLMPDCEVSQKKYYDFGSIVLCFNRFCHAAPGRDLDSPRFQSTYKILENGIDSETGLYSTKIQVDAQNVKIYRKIVESGTQNESIGIIRSSTYIVRIRLPKWTYNTIIMKNWDGSYIYVVKDGEVVVSRGGNNIYCVKKPMEYGESFTIEAACLDENHGIEFLSSEGYLTNNKIRAYTGFHFNLSWQELQRGVLISKRKKWFYIENGLLNNVCVKHGGMKFLHTGRDGDYVVKTVWKLTRKNTKKISCLYYAYSHPQNGGKKKNKNTGEWVKFRPRHGRQGNYRLKWIKCNWIYLEREWFYHEGVRMDAYLGLRKQTQSALKSLAKHLHFLRRGRIRGFSYLNMPILFPNFSKNCYELYHLNIQNNDSNTGLKIKSLKFVKNVNVEDAYQLYKKHDCYFEAE